jgi:hypothetical protein
MSGDKEQIRVVLDEDASAVVVRGGVRVQFNAGGGIDIYGYAPVMFYPGVKDEAYAKAPLRAGDLDDGGVYVGPSAENGKPLHAALADLPEYKTDLEAVAAAERLQAEHPTAHVPTHRELDKNLYANRNTGRLKGTFNTSGSTPESVYRSATSYINGDARVQWFGEKDQEYHRIAEGRFPVRLVW